MILLEVRIMRVLEFDPRNIRKKDMDKLADAIEDYIDLLKNIMIIPDNIKDKHEDEIKGAIKIAQKLIKKLRNGDTSVFKSEEEWNPIT